MLEIMASLIVAATIFLGITTLFRVVLWEDRFQEEGPDKIVELD